MGKILDTITVLFKGDTSDLKRKKKEAEDLAAETAKNIKEIQTSTIATTAALENTNKALTQTENTTANIGEGIAAWVIAAHQASTGINEAIGAEKAHREQVRIAKGLASTKKGADEVEKALKGVVKEFATAALGALTVGRAVGLFKDVVTGTLDLQRSAYSLNIDSATIDAFGRAAQAAGSGIEEYITALESLSAKVGGVTGQPLQDIFEAQLRSIRKIKGDIEAEAFGRNLGIPSGIVRAARQGAFEQENIENIRQIDSGITKATEKVDLLSKAWSEFRTNVRGTFLDLENTILGPLTHFIGTLNNLYERGREEATRKPNIQNLFKFNFPEYVGGPIQPKSSAFPLTKGDTVTRVVSVKIGDVFVQVPEGRDPKEFARNFYSELAKETSDFLNYHDNSIVG